MVEYIHTTIQNGGQYVKVKNINNTFIHQGCIKLIKSEL